MFLSGVAEAGAVSRKSIGVGLAAREAHQKEASTTDVAGAGVGHRQRERHGHRSVDGVAAAPQHLGADVGGVGFDRGDHARRRRAPRACPRRGATIGGSGGGGGGYAGGAGELAAGGATVATAELAVGGGAVTAGRGGGGEGGALASQAGSEASAASVSVKREIGMRGEREGIARILHPAAGRTRRGQLRRRRETRRPRPAIRAPIAPTLKRSSPEASEGAAEQPTVVLQSLPLMVVVQVVVVVMPWDSR